MRNIHPLYPHTYTATVIKDVSGCFGCSPFKAGEVVVCVILENASEPGVYTVDFTAKRRQNSVDFTEVKKYLKCTGIATHNGAEHLRSDLIGLWNDAMR